MDFGDSRLSSNVVDKRGQGLLQDQIDQFRLVRSLPTRAGALASNLLGAFSPRFGVPEMNKGLQELGAMLPGRSLIGTTPVSLVPENPELASIADSVGAPLGGPTLAQILRGRAFGSR